MNPTVDTIIIGGGQSALACAYYLRRSSLDFLVLDDQPEAGGSWRRCWDSLTLFSPAEFSSLPGWLMPKSKGKYPSRLEVTSYLKQYEQRYKLPVRRPVKVESVCRKGQLFEVQTDEATYYARTVISATGTFQKPYIPHYPGQETFQGLSLHSSAYQYPQPFTGKRVLIVGGGNSGAQVLAEVSKVAQTTWVTLEAPSYLPDDVDGRVLFDQASARYYAMQKGGQPDPAQYNLGNIVMVPSVLEARERGVLKAVPPFEKFYEHGVVWQEGTKEAVDAIVWCTGFGYALAHLECLQVVNEKGQVATEGTRALEQPGLWLIGYGGWTGFASATLIGVGRTARETARQVENFISAEFK
ncbi:MAG: ArsO family NAD(P)H-dependent flavin-containing monooxygenase [Hymenobacteraceae bacterium]|nr:ArsO family NAD(P)H-dependent flavin-containing monooxygenase [Hymenobacteraceae bacterium]MDX5482158.1 ArsO family NAD(P)H-dependent flavin-containing monooxygenase [Hymenobacteraceae bacterium]